jgi:hypothetical protein
MACDDEYWENDDPKLAFVQPPGRPSIVTFFVYHLQLYEILAFALRTLYAPKKSRLLLGLVGEDWEQKLVTQLDSSMNNWLNSVPDHRASSFLSFVIQRLMSNQFVGIHIAKTSYICFNPPSYTANTIMCKSKSTGPLSGDSHPCHIPL